MSSVRRGRTYASLLVLMTGAEVLSYRSILAAGQACGNQLDFAPPIALLAALVLASVLAATLMRMPRADTVLGIVLVVFVALPADAVLWFTFFGMGHCGE